MGLSIGLAILGAVSVGAAFLMRPKTPHIKTEGPRLDELQATTSQYGIGIPRVWGVYTVPGNVIWVGRVREHKKTTTSRSGGKGGGGGSKQTHTEYSYTVSVAIGLASAQHRPLRRILRIMMDNQTVYDVTGGSVDQTIKGLYWRFYDGSETQQPDSVIAAQEGRESTPAFRGLSYILFEELPITNFGNRIPQVRVLVEAEGSPSYCISRPLPVSLSMGTDAIPANFDTGRAVLVGRVGGGAYGLYELDLHKQEVLRQVALGSDGYTPSAVGFGRGQTMVLGGYDGNLYRRTRLELWDARALRRRRTHRITQNLGEGGSQIAVGEYISAFDGTHRTIACVSYGPASLGMSGTRTADIVDVENGRNVLVGVRGGDFGEPIIHDYRYIHSYFAHLGDFATSTEFYWLHADVDVDDYGRNPVRKQSMSLYIAEVKDRLKIRKFLGASVGFSIRPELSKRKLITLRLSDIDPQGRVKSFYSSGGGFLDRLGQGNCIVDGIVPCADGGFVIFACSQAFTVRYNSSGRIMWRFASDEEYVWSSSPLESSFSRVRVHGYRAGSTLAVRGRKDGRLGIYTLDVMTGKPLSFCDGTNSVAINYDASTRSYVDSRSITYLENFDRGSVQVATITDDLSKEVGLQHGEYAEIAGLTMSGYLQSKPASAKEILAPLANIFSFDCVERNGQLRWFMRGGHSIGTYAPADMVQAVSGDAFEVTRKEDTALPQAVSITYAEEKKSHERNTVYRQRYKGNEGYETVRSRNQLNLEAPVSITVNQAKRAADIVLMSLWNGRTSYKLRLPRADLLIEVGDIITIEIEGQFPEDIYVDRVSIGADLQLEIEGVSQDSSQYTSLVGGDVGSGYVAPTIEHPRYTRLYMLPIPHLLDESDVQGRALTVYFAMGAYEEGWRAGVLERLTTNGGYEEVGLQPTSAAHGILVSGVPLATEHTVFATNWDLYIDVTMLHGELETVSYEEVLDGANALAIIYSTNEAEIVQFNRAELINDDTYRLTGLVRGQRGTDWLATSKPMPEGADVVFLSDGDVGAVHMSLDRLDDVGIFRGYNATQEPEDGDTRGLVLAGYELKPWAPVHLVAVVLPGGDIEVKWVRRTRVNGGLQDGSDDVPVGELEERYEIDVLVGQEVVRTLESDIESVTYALAQRVEDGTDQLIGSIEFHVYQISPMVGRGYRGVVTAQGVDIEVAQQSAGVLYELGRPAYDVAQLNATVLQSLTVELRAAQQSLIVLHEHPYLPDLQIAQQSLLAMHKPIHGYVRVAQNTNIVLHEVEI